MEIENISVLPNIFETFVLKQISLMKVGIRKMSDNMNDSEIAISIIVPVYNLERYIGLCIESVLNQTFKNYELILVDDYSDDNTKRIIRAYIQHEETANIILLENDKKMDAGTSRNRGLDIARGEYLLFLDGDDTLEYNALELMYNVCQNNKVDIVIYNFSVFNNNTHEIKECNAPVDKLIKERESFVLSDISDCSFQYFHETAWDKIFRRKFIQENGIKFQCQDNANDQYFVYAALLKAKSIIKISDYLLRYRINREDQLSTSGNISRNPKCIWCATKATLDCIDNMGLYDMYRKSIHTYAVSRLIFSLKQIKISERENLFDFYKNEGFKALKMDNCSIEHFEIPYFFALYKWFVSLDSIKKLEEISTWSLWSDENKWKRLFDELTLEKKITLWGAGVNGGRFLERIYDYKLDIRYVVDMDENKIGRLLYGYEIKPYSDVENGDLIVALHPDHILAIRHLMKRQKKKVKILDARAYLHFDIDYEQAKFEVL